MGLRSASVARPLDVSGKGVGLVREMEPSLPDFSRYSVLVAGSGSIGRRHMANLRKLGVTKLAAADHNAEHLRSVMDELRVEGFADFKGALSARRPDVVFVCTPPVFHVEQCLEAVRRGAHVFVEKPLCDRLDLVDELLSEAARCGRVVHVGYNLRFHPGVQALKRLLDEGVIGRVLWARVEVGQYLPDWRPWQDYRKSYTAQREMGGGIILDASHEIDYLMWLLGPPSELTCMAGKVSGLDVDVEDCATILLRFPGGAQVDVHMDFVQRIYSRSCTLVGDSGNLTWDYAQNHVQIVRPEREIETIDYSFEPNQMYLSELRHFLECVENGTATNKGLAEAKLTLQVALAARRSAAEKKWVSFGG